MRSHTWYRVSLLLLTVAFAALAQPLQVNAGTLADVRARGTLNCGVSEGLVGFSAQDSHKEWVGFDVDFCRAVSAAVFGRPDKVTFVPLSATNRFDALKSKRIDILARNTTWTLGRDVVLELEFIGVSYYDGQGFMTSRSNGLSSALQLAKATICILEGTTSQTNATQYFAERNIDVNFSAFKDRNALVKAYAEGRCDAYSADLSGLASVRLGLNDPASHMFLPEVISKEPLGPVVRQADPQWADLTRWVLFLLVNAEEAGWTKALAISGELPKAIKTTAEVNTKLGLDAKWSINVIKWVGNYGEIFARNIGKDSSLGLSRGINALWTRGGILYAPPLR